MAVNLILIRHGAILGNERRYIGQTTNTPLSERGIRELSDRKSRGIYPSAEVLYTSPLSRCTQTARLLYPTLVPVYLDSLVELDYGIFEGKAYEQLKENPSFKRWIDSDGTVPPPGGESAPDFSQRLDETIRHIAGDALLRSFHTAAVITHGSCIKELIRLFHPKSGKKLDLTEFQAVNGGGWQVELDTASLKFNSIKAI